MPNSERINYVKVSKDYINDYMNMVNDMDTAKFITHNPRTYTYEEEEKWVEEQIKNNANIFSMIEKDTNKFIGNIEIKEEDNEIGIYITKEMQDKHYGTEAMKAIIEYAFSTLGLDEVTLKVYPNNARAIKCYKNVGFIEYNRDEENIYMKKTR